MIKKQIRYFKRDFHLKELFKGSSIALVFKSFGILMQYLLFFYIARKYGSEMLGIFSTCFTILLIGSVFGKLGLDTSIVKFIAQLKAIKKDNFIFITYITGFKLVFISGLLVAMLIYLTSGYLSRVFFNTPDAQHYMKLVSYAVFTFVILGYNAEILRGLKRITFYSFFQNGSIYLLMLLFLYAGVFNSSKEGVIESLTLSVLVLMLFSFLILRNGLAKYLPGYSKEKYFTSGKILKTSWPMMLSNSLFFVMNWIDILMLSYFKDESMVGIYNTCVKIAGINSVALIAINSIASPKFAELYAQNYKSKFKRFVKHTSLLNVAISLPIFLLIVIFPKDLLSIFGGEFVSGSGALLILVAGQMFNSLSGSTMHLINMTGQEKTGRNIILFGAILNFILNFILIPVYGIEGAAFATAFSTITWNVLAHISIYKKHHFTTFPFGLKIW
ncbi:MAG: flippase [Chlorobi bacterium]|nr:flippase [Chlorobiota bacterium]